MSGSRNTIRVPAFRVAQSAEGVLYSFVVDGKRIPEFAAVSRIGRDDGQDVVGYQRPEVARHIAEIREYLESDDAVIPNAIVISFDQTVQFESVNLSGDVEGVETGYLEIPNVEDGEAKPGWIVDGQQRVAAIRDADLPRRGFPICVVAFVATNERVQREQFILVNSTKPLPRGLIYELLPHTETRLATSLEVRRFPATLLEHLNRDEESPFFGRIKTPTNPAGVIKDNSILRMLENSLYEGALYEYRDPLTGRGDIDAMVEILNRYWRAVSWVFGDAWEGTPRTSRLVHGAGIVAMGQLMDAVFDRLQGNGIPQVRDFQEELLPLQGACYWTQGVWPFGEGKARAWDQVQNTAKDIRLLTDYLRVQYKVLVWQRDKVRST